MNQEDDPFRVARLILELRQIGLTDSVLLNAFEKTPRHAFVSPDLQEHAYEDVALPIACGQTMSRPTTVAGIVNALELGDQRNLTVLEIGTGSGFMAALMSRLSRRVYTVDRYRTLVEKSRQTFEALGLFNVISRCSDGAEGWKEAAPFDRIVSTCAMEEPPETWVSQLKSGGILVMPVGTNEDQYVARFRLQDDRSLTREPLAPSRFLHLVEGVAKQL